MSRTLAVAAALLALAVTGAAGSGAGPGEPPYDCGYCLFEARVDGKDARIVLDLLRLKLLALLAVSPDRSEILYARTDPVSYHVDLWRADVDGKRRRLLAPDVSGSARWSPDGRRIAYQRGFDIWVLDGDGTGLRRAVRGPAILLRWAPDSRRVAFLAGVGGSGGVLSVADVDGTATHRVGIVEAGGSDLHWSPRGDRVAYSAVGEPSPPSGEGRSIGGPRHFQPTEIDVVDVSDGRRRVLTTGQSPAWSPDGRRIALTSERPAVLDVQEAERRYGPSVLGVVNAAGGRARPIATRCCGGTGPAWSPNGRRLAFVGGDRAFTDQVFVVRPDGRGRRQITRQLPGGLIEALFWHPNGRKILYVWEFTDVDLRRRQHEDARGPSISAARMCIGAYWDAVRHECARDQHRQPFTYYEADCSVRYSVSRATRFEATLSYEGRAQRTYTATVRGRGHRGIGINFPIDYPGSETYGLPAGSYACDIKVGAKTVHIPFRSRGPRGDVLIPGVCAARAQVEHSCGAVQAYGAIPATHSVSCSATFARLEGHAVEIELRRRDGAGWTTLHAAHDVLPAPIVEEWTYASGPSREFLAPGRYECRIAVDGAVRVVRPFEIAPGDAGLR